MPAENEGVYIPIQFSLEEARAALRQIEVDARKSGQGMKAGLEGAGQAAGGLGKGISGLKEQMGRSREAAMFFTQSLGEFGPHGRTAQIAISGVAGALMGGGGLLLALSLAQAGVRLLVEAWEEEARVEKERAEAFIKAEREIGERRAKARDAVLGDVEAYRARNARLKAELRGVTDEEYAHEQVLKKIQVAMRDATEAGIGALRYRMAETIDLYNQNRALERNIELRKEEKKAAEEDAKEQAAMEGEMPRAGLVGLGDTLPAAQAMTDSVITLSHMRAAAYLEETTALMHVRLGLHGAGDEATRMAKTMRDSLAREAVSAFKPLLMQSSAYARAMREVGGEVENAADLSGPAFAAMAQNALAGLAVEAGQRSLFYLFEGIALAASLNPGASGKFAAAAGMAALAGAAGGGAYGIGQNRGMTAAERQAVDSQREIGSGSGGGAREYGGSGGGSGGGDRVVRETLFIIGPAGMTEAEMARIQARVARTAERLGYMRGATAADG